MMRARPVLVHMVAVAGGLLGACLGGVPPACAGGFTAFAEDEDVCRRAGSAAIAGASGPSAAQRYDFAYRRCMAYHSGMRWRRMPSEAIPPGPGFAERNPHSFDRPDAFYSIPYATPGYGYDGFGY